MYYIMLSAQLLECRVYALYTVAKSGSLVDIKIER